MEIILKHDIAKLGFANDIISVKDGYANNYLIPQGLAIAATESNKKVLAENLRQKAHKEEKIKADAQAIATSLEGAAIKIGAKVGTSGKIFGSVNNIQIAEALKEQLNQDIDRKKIEVNGENVKEVGTYTAKINLHREVIVEITFEVVAE